MTRELVINVMLKYFRTGVRIGAYRYSVQKMAKTVIENNQIIIDDDLSSTILAIFWSE